MTPCKGAGLLQGRHRIESQRGSSAQRVWHGIPGGGPARQGTGTVRISLALDQQYADTYRRLGDFYQRSNEERQGYRGLWGGPGHRPATLISTAIWAFVC